MADKQGRHERRSGARAPGRVAPASASAAAPEPAAWPAGTAEGAGSVDRAETHRPVSPESSGGPADAAEGGERTSRSPGEAGGTTGEASRLRSEPGRSLCQLSAATHTDVAQLIEISQHAEASAGDPRRSLRASDVAIAAVSAHLAVMESTVYPQIRRRLPDGRRRLRALQNQAREVRSVARGIEQLVNGDQHRPPESLGQLRAELSELMAAHALEEESLVAELERSTDPAERRQLATTVEQAMRHAPTRPHPHLRYRARIGPRVRVALAGRWDHLLDTMDARVGAGTPVKAPAPAGLWGWYLLGRPTSPEPAGQQPAGQSSAVRVESSTTSPPTSP